MASASFEPMSHEFLDFYSGGTEAERLERGIGPLERARSRELIARHLPPPPAVVCDLGGGSGAYSFWLAGLGYDVHLVDAVALHIEQAQARARSPAFSPLASMQVGDARKLSHPDEFADAVILHGPLYHLTARDDRLQAIAEAGRILRPGGVLLAFAITCYASTIVGLIRGWVWDADYFDMIADEVTTGQHRRPASWPTLFTTAFFHHPEQLRAELEAAGLPPEAILAVQGPAWMVPEFEESWQDEGRREVILKVARLLEHEPVMSPHMVAVARKGG